MSIRHLFRSLVFPFPSNLRRAFRLLHSTYIHPYVRSMNLTASTTKLDAMKTGSSIRVITLALLKMVQLRRLAIDFACPAGLYEYIRNSKQIKQLIWTTLSSRPNNPGQAQCQLEAIEFSAVRGKCYIPAGLIVNSASTLKSLSVHSGEYLPILCGYAQAHLFSDLTSFTFSGMEENIEPRTSRDILELCPSIIALHLPTPLEHAFLLSPVALPKLHTLDAGPNGFALRFLEGRPVRRLFAHPPTSFSDPSEREPLRNCLFSLLHVRIAFTHVKEFFIDVNRTLIYCEDLALRVSIDRLRMLTVRHFLTFTISISHLTLNSVWFYSYGNADPVARRTESGEPFTDNPGHRHRGLHKKFAASFA